MEKTASNQQNQPPQPTSVLAVANELIGLGVQNSNPLTHLQIQKMAYIAQGCFLALFDTPLFIADVKAWKHGPVIEEIYHEFKYYGKEPITAPAATDYRITNEDQKRIIRKVYEIYSDKKPWELVEKTHRPGAPWFEAKRNGRSIISQEAMEEYYKGILKKAENGKKHAA